jgi:hypothetical protein
MKQRLSLIIALGFCISIPVQAQPKLFSTESWCNDSGTLCWGSPNAGTTITGVRFIGEVNLGTIIQDSDNRFESKVLSGLIQAGVEFNIYKGFVAVQGTLIPPGSIQLDTDSPLVTSQRLKDPDRRMKVDIGGTVGFSFLDGILAAGIGGLKYDTRSISGILPDEKRARFYYLQLQPLSAIRVAIKRSKPNVALR